MDGLGAVDLKFSVYDMYWPGAGKREISSAMRSLTLSLQVKPFFFYLFSSKKVLF